METNVASDTLGHRLRGLHHSRYVRRPLIGTKRPYTEASPKQDNSSEVDRIGVKHRVFAGDAEKGYVTPSPDRKGFYESPRRHANPDPTSWSDAYNNREGFELHVHTQNKCEGVQDGFEMLQ